MVTGYEVDMYRNIARIANALDRKPEPTQLETFLREAGDVKAQVRLVLSSRGETFGYVEEVDGGSVRLFKTPPDKMPDDDDPGPKIVALQHIVLAEYV